MEDIGMNPEFRALGPGFEEPTLKCYVCGAGCEDYCWHCEKPVCARHSTLEKTEFATTLYCDRCYEADRKYHRMNDMTRPYNPHKLYVEGYFPIPPSDMVGKLDGGSIRNSPCAKCHHEELIYEPWSKPGSYMAIALCPDCGYREEY